MTHALTAAGHNNKMAYYHISSTWPAYLIIVQASKVSMDSSLHGNVHMVSDPSSVTRTIRMYGRRTPAEPKVVYLYRISVLQTEPELMWYDEARNFPGMRVNGEVKDEV